MKNEKWFLFDIPQIEKKLKTNAASGLSRKAARSRWSRNSGSLLLEKRKPWEVADLIIEGAKARAKFSDDMTCCVIKIEKRKEG